MMKFFESIHCFATIETLVWIESGPPLSGVGTNIQVAVIIGLVFILAFAIAALADGISE